MSILTLDHNTKPVENMMMGPSTCDPAFRWWWEDYEYLNMIDRGGGREIHEHKYGFMWAPLSAASTRDPIWIVTPYGRGVEYPNLSNQMLTAPTGSPYWVGDLRPVTVGVIFQTPSTSLRAVLSLGAAGTNGMRWDVRPTDSQIRAVANGIANVSIHSVAISVDTWYMYVFSWDGNNFAGVLKNLETGSIDIHTGTNTSTPGDITSVTEIRIGPTLDAYRFVLAYWARRFTPLSAQLQWADDPFGPMRVLDDDLGFVAAAPPAGIVVLRRRREAA